MNENEPAFPELWTAQLTEGVCEQLLAELQTHATILNVREKQSESGYSEDTASTLDRFRSGQSHGIQICYGYQGKEWCDTIIRQSNGYKLIRTVER